jgi:hypothetical protein
MVKPLAPIPPMTIKDILFILHQEGHENQKASENEKA